MEVFTNLIKLLDKKLNDLEYHINEDATSIKKIQDEIKMINGIVRTLEEDPLSIYTMSSDVITVVGNSLSLDSAAKKKIESYKVIYDCYNKFGKEYVPQFGSIEEYANFLCENLKEKEKTLPDEVTPYQLSVIKNEETYQSYYSLQEELTSSSVIFQGQSIEIINDLLKELDATEEEAFEVKLKINAENERIYKALLNATKEEIALPEATPKDSGLLNEITKIEENLKANFQEESLTNLKTLSELLSKCEDKESFDRLIEEWKFVWGDVPLNEVIDGLIELKLMDKMVIDIIDITENDKNKESEKIEQQIQYLNMYIDKLLDDEEQEEQTQALDMPEGKINQALAEYKEGILDTPNCVICLSDNVERDIEDIYDKQTLEDVFLLIEQLRNDKVENSKKLGQEDGKLAGLISLKPNSRGRQARVVCIKIASNIYGIVNITGKKADNPSSWIKTLKSRRNTIDVEKINADLQNPDMFAEYENRTLNVYNKLINKIAPEKENELTGGAK